MKLRHVVSAQQFDPQVIKEIFQQADKFKKNKVKKSLLKGKIMATLFYEPSTRTRLSFESAMHRLGGRVISTENAAEFSSAAKGETLEDTIRVINSFCDVIVLRHFQEGATQLAASFSNVPVINAGDGKGEHPTQALLDLYTIFSSFNIKNQKKDKVDITITMVGDLKYGRTIHSLCYLLSQYKNVKLNFISPKELKIPKELKNHLEKSKIKFTEADSLDKALKSSNVIYQTRVQKERFKSEKEYEKLRNKFIINERTIKNLPKKSIIMHPLPRVNELATAVDSDPRAVYFEQVQNGLYTRMALLAHLFDKRR